MIKRLFAKISPKNGQFKKAKNVSFAKSTDIQ